MDTINAQQLWDNLSYPTDKYNWVSFFNKVGVNGELLETADTVSFISPAKDRAIKLTHNLGNQHSVFGWISDFGDKASGRVKVLNIYFSEVNQDLNSINSLIQRWTDGKTSYQEMADILTALLVVDSSNHIQIALPAKHSYLLLDAVKHRLESWEQAVNSGELNEDQIADINNDSMLLQGVQDELEEKLATYYKQALCNSKKQANDD